MRSFYIASAALLAFSACGHAGPQRPVTGAVQSWSVDPRNGRLASVTIQVTNNTDRLIDADYAIIQSKLIGYWQPTTSRLRPRESERVVLRPSASTTVPVIGDVAIVVATDKATAIAFPLASFAVEGRTDEIINPAFRDWPNGRTSPQAWTFYHDRGTSIGIAMAPYHGRQSLLIRARNRAPTLHYAFVQQKVSVSQVVLQATAFNDDSCGAPALEKSPAQTAIELNGVEVSDDVGNLVFYCLSSRTSHGILKRLSPAQLLVFVPAKPQSWQTFKIRLDALPPRLHFRSDRLGLINVRAMVQFYGSSGALSLAIAQLETANSPVARSTAGTSRRPNQRFLSTASQR